MSPEELEAALKDVQKERDGWQRAALLAQRREEAAREEAKGWKRDHDGACALVAAMHAAAVGEIRGPIRGVVEDVADLRAERDAAQAQVERLRLALRNVRGLAKRLRKTDAETAGHFLRFCDEAGVRDSLLRAALAPAPAEKPEGGDGT